jgi:hypothetical protein
MIETYCMLGRQREAELVREAERLHVLGPLAGVRTAKALMRRAARLFSFNGDHGGAGYSAAPVASTDS